MKDTISKIVIKISYSTIYNYISCQDEKMRYNKKKLYSLLS